MKKLLLFALFLQLSVASPSPALAMNYEECAKITAGVSAVACLGSLGLRFGDLPPIVNTIGAGGIGFSGGVFVISSTYLLGLQCYRHCLRAQLGDIEMGTDAGSASDSHEDQGFDEENSINQEYLAELEVAAQNCPVCIQDFAPQQVPDFSFDGIQAISH